MRAWWGSLSLRARLAFAFGAMAAGALLFLLAIVARTIGIQNLEQGKIIPATLFAFAVFFVGGWFVAGWCLREIGRLGGRAVTTLSSTATGVTATRVLPAELEGLASLLRRETARHDSVLAELKRFTADAAHELRTPLTAMRTTGEVALRAAGDDPHSIANPVQLRSALETMLEDALRMNNLLERLLRLARLENDNLVLRHRSLQLAEHLATLCDNLHVLAEEKQQRIELHCPPAITFTTDPEILDHALTNILHNAIRYSPPQSTVRVDARLSPATIPTLLIDIADQGPGIAPEHQPRIFERFYRIDASRSRNGEDSADTSGAGSGLGLCIARTAIERLHGTITLNSTPGQGTCFTLRLPLVPHQPT
ncbi:sensor histidine kinase [Opitutaceae bacterium TAV4]|nr:sensor histidine kinase [Opitutaceae bacterium TAV4]RRJ98357.1 sensor histidine kinase [Opitutaceae bacterium TAV3]